MMRTSKNKKQQAFTLIELVIVMLLIGILSSVAIMRFGDLGTQAVETSLEYNLVNIRSALVIKRGENIGSSPLDDTRGVDNTGAPLTGLVSWWPLFSQMNTPGEILSNAMPVMRKGSPGDVNTVFLDVTGDVDTRPITAGGGWNYNPNNGTFWANTDEDNANEW